LPGEWLRRLHYLVNRRAIEEDMRQEMEAHRALLDEPQSFGNTLRLREDARDAWGWRWLDELTQDTRFALRALRRSPGFTVTAVVTLALGIGVNSGVFGLVNDLLLRPLYERPDGVVSVHGRSTRADGGLRGLSYPDYVELHEATLPIFETLAAYSTTFVGVDTGEGARRTMVSGVSADYFQVFGQPLMLGRAFAADESRPGAASRVAILSHALWQRRGADSQILGRSVRG
jgi:hypothetical protein